MESLDVRVHQGRAGRWAMFAWFFVVVGFALGTVALLGPVRWMLVAIRARARLLAFENFAVVLAILALVGATAVLSHYLTARAMRTGRRWVQVALFLGCALPAGIALWAWMTPALMVRASASGPTETIKVASFTFGPYPDEAKLRELKAEGYSGVITLLHPAVVPFEPRLLATETAAASRAGIPLIHLPMLPWVSSNAKVLAAIRQLAKSPDKRYYVHCYLGMDRVNVVRRVVESMQAATISSAPQAGRGQRLEARVRARGFERGPVLKLAEGVFVTPYPTGEEWNSHIIGGSIRTVVSLLDPEREDDRDWIAQERELLESVAMTFVSAPIPASGWGRANAAAAAAEAVAAAQQPVVVHGFLIPSEPTDAFLDAYKRRDEFIQRARAVMWRVTRFLKRGPRTPPFP